MGPREPERWPAPARAQPEASRRVVARQGAQKHASAEQQEALQGAPLAASEPHWAWLPVARRVEVRAARG